MFLSRLALSLPYLVSTQNCTETRSKKGHPGDHALGCSAMKIDDWSGSCSSILPCFSSIVSYFLPFSIFFPSLFSRRLLLQCPLNSLVAIQEHTAPLIQFGLIDLGRPTEAQFSSSRHFYVPHIITSFSHSFQFKSQLPPSLISSMVQFLRGVTTTR
jgi:hypothetical protein